MKLLAQLLQSCYNMFENIFLQALVLFTDAQVCICIYFISAEQLFGLFANLKKHFNQHCNKTVVLTV